MKWRCNGKMDGCRKSSSDLWMEASPREGPHRGKGRLETESEDGEDAEQGHPGVGSRLRGPLGLGKEKLLLMISFFFLFCVLIDYRNFPMNAKSQNFRKALIHCGGRGRARYITHSETERGRQITDFPMHPFSLRWKEQTEKALKLPREALESKKEH